MMMRLLAVAWLGVVSSMALVKKRVLVVGGSGRVGGSTVTELRKMARRKGLDVDITVGGRSRQAYDAAARRSEGVSLSAFTQCDITDPQSLETAMQNTDLVVHTAGPFQQKRTPEVLDVALKLGVDYLDVCDETFLCDVVKQPRYLEEAKKNGVSAVVSAGIWPGVSALMAQLAKEELGGCDTLDFSFFTAGTGNAGPTIVSATFLLLCTPALCFADGAQVDAAPWSDPRMVDFGDAGTRKVRLLDCPDVKTVATSLKISNVTSRFSTAPEIWNGLFGLSQRILPPSVLADRGLMQKLSLFSEPIIRLVDYFVGAKNVMRVDASFKEKKVTLIHAHEDLEKAVGIATAAFAMELLLGNLEPGIYWPSDLAPKNRDAIIEDLLHAPGTLEWSTTASTPSSQA